MFSAVFIISGEAACWGEWAGGIKGEGTRERRTLLPWNFWGGEGGSGLGVLKEKAQGRGGPSSPETSACAVGY